MRDKIFTGKIKSIKTNNKGLPETFEEKSDRKNQESDEQPDNTGTPKLESDKSDDSRKKKSTRKRTKNTNIRSNV